MTIKEFINVLLRGLTLFLKFSLTILLIKYLSVEDFGLFSLIQSTVIILTFVVGLDYYNFSHREMIRSKFKDFSLHLNQQLLIYFITYLAVIPLAYFLSNTLRLENYFILILLVIAEHLSQEFYRVLVILNKTITATLVLFFRSGVWIIILWGLINIKSMQINLQYVLYLWLLGCVSSIFYSLKNIRFKINLKFKKSVLRDGLIQSIPFFIGTLFFKILEYSGRYFLTYYFDNEKVGVFSFFSNISNILFVVVQTVVFIELYPGLITYRNQGINTFIEKLKIFKTKTIKISLICFFILLVLSKPILIVLDKEPLIKDYMSFLVLLFAALVFTCSFIYHYALYTYSKDKLILYSIIISFIVNILLNFILVPHMKIMGASLSYLFSMLILLVSKMLYWYKSKNSALL